MRVLCVPWKSCRSPLARRVPILRQMTEKLLFAPMLHKYFLPLYEVKRPFFIVLIHTFPIISGDEYDCEAVECKVQVI